MDNSVDIAVGYHKPSIIFQSDALKPIHLGKASSKLDFGICGDDTGDHISGKNKWYGEDTGLYWLWKNSNANIKGLMHSYCLLDLRLPDRAGCNLVLEDIGNPEHVVTDLGLDRENISALMQTVDILIGQRQSVRNNWFRGNIEERYKTVHIIEYWDYMMEIIKEDFPDIYKVAQSVAANNRGYFANLCVMKAELFDAMCKFRFAVLEKLDKRVDLNRPEIAGGWIYTARYGAFLAEYLTMFYVEYLCESGKRILECPIVSITPRRTNITDVRTHTADIYSTQKGGAALDPVFGKGAVTIMLATDNNYAFFAGVMIQSVKDNADPNRCYDIVVVGNLSGDKKRLLETMADKNISIRVVDMNPFLHDIDSSIFAVNGYFTIETYYRFFIPRLFYKYEKVLYLDVDMVVLRDVAQLYDADIGNNWWGVTRERRIEVCGFKRGTFWESKFIPYLKETLKMDSAFNYFQAGVMIWNVKQCIKDNVCEQLIDRLKEIGAPRYVDQCVMNSLANGKHIHWLPGNWNVLWDVPFNWVEGMESEGFKTAMHLLDNPFIIHFASVIKPWDQPYRLNADKFWQYARRTPFYELILLRKETKKMREREVARCKRKARQYEILNLLTLESIKSFRRRRSRYRSRIKLLDQVETGMDLSCESSIQDTNRGKVINF